MSGPQRAASRSGRWPCAGCARMTRGTGASRLLLSCLLVLGCGKSATGERSADSDEVTTETDGATSGTDVGMDAPGGGQGDATTDGDSGASPNPQTGVEPDAEGTDSPVANTDTMQEVAETGDVEPSGTDSPQGATDAGGPGTADETSGDAGGSEAPAAIEPVQPEGTVPMFVAVGHAGRTVLSCDDGRSWVADRSDDVGRRCFDEAAGSFDCDHSSDAGTGIAYGNGWFVATFGWGSPGTIRRSPDGLNWEIVAQGDDADAITSSGLAWGLDMFLTGARSPHVAGPEADVWERGPELPLGDVWNVRKIAFAPTRGGTFVMFAQDAESMLATSTDGMNWEFSATGGEYCGGNNIAYGGGVLLMAGEGGCRSTDGGLTWEPLQLPAAANTPTLWTGTQFVYWGLDDEYRDTRYSSGDGIDWEQQPTTLDTGGTLRPGPVALSPRGTYVAVRDEWLGWYEKQRFYRSEDGVEWTEVREGSYTGSHPLRQIVFGYGQPSGFCPGP